LTSLDLVNDFIENSFSTVMSVEMNNKNLFFLIVEIFSIF